MLAILTDFLALSQILTGVEALDAELGRGYFERLTSGPLDPLVIRILERFREMKGDANIVNRVKEKILAEDDLRPAVCQIMGANAPGLWGGYFGHWRYRPENAPKGRLCDRRARSR